MTNNETTNLIERTIESSFEFLNNFSIRQLKKKKSSFPFLENNLSFLISEENQKIWEISDNVAKRFRLARIYYSLDIVGLKKKISKLTMDALWPLSITQFRYLSLTSSSCFYSWYTYTRNLASNDSCPADNRVWVS